MMRNKSLEVEDAIIELGKVQSLTNVLNIGITDSPNVNDIQNASNRYVPKGLCGIAKSVVRGGGGK